MSADENQTLQDEEIEALAAIYGDDWEVVDSESRKYHIRISDEKLKNAILMEVSFPPDYPKTAPPQYILSAPWLLRDEKTNLEGSLADIYCENIGESIIYLWVEKIREFLQERNELHVKADTTAGNSEAVIQEHMLDRKTEEEDEILDIDFLNVQEKPDKCHFEEQENSSDDVNCPEIHHGKSFVDRKSVFQGHIASISHTKQVKLVLDSLCQSKKIAAATHNIYAYRISSKDKQDVFYQGCEDDGETQAGSRMLHLMQIVDACNVIVVVTRWYGGVHLGPDRFKHINNCARQLLDEHGYIQSKNEKKGPKSNKRRS
ncbi:protein IMPACT-B-like isoform X1 [Crassostrea angulata]|uniref:protein IMPACT-B-like isoform X1 n=1 Tax=Magallana angulata TaxID=2784310 RepID=UPI0022B13BE1|nr:protein IMPACT-B-like isoform X1 [Crassostrea angulata]